MPLAIELAAARVRALSLNEILNSLHDRFKLLTGGARTAVRRQQTLRASVDWSHALLTEPERVLFRRLAVFMGGFDLDAAQAVAGIQMSSGTGPRPTQPARRQITRCRRERRRLNAVSLLETVRQYAMEKLGESAKRKRYVRGTATTTPRWPIRLDAPPHDQIKRHVEQAEIGNRQSSRGIHMESREQRRREQRWRSRRRCSPVVVRGRVLEGAHGLTPQ